MGDQKSWKVVNVYSIEIVNEGGRVVKNVWKIVNVNWECPLSKGLIFIFKVTTPLLKIGSFPLSPHVTFWGYPIFPTWGDVIHRWSFMRIWKSKYLNTLPFNKLLAVMCIVDSLFISCNIMSILRSLGVKYGKIFCVNSQIFIKWKRIKTYNTSPNFRYTRNYLLLGYILGVLTHTSS